ncbi:DNA-binding protein WhiA, partial [Priestia megaterium]|uniref:DNA-binding protein WhiA n=1 Tax=Priestia megaterium TaxID=1404 RepID=UPI0021C1C434
MSPQLVQNKSCNPSYLTPPFLPAGSINNPHTSSYHLQIFSFYQHHNQPLSNLINQFQFNTKTLQPKKRYINYLK